MPAGFEPFTPITRAGSRPEPEPEPDVELAPAPPPEATPEPDAEPPPVAPAAVAKPALTAAELAARRESRTGRAYSPGRQAGPAQPAVARETPEPEAAVAVPPSARRVLPRVLAAIAACAVLIAGGAAFALRGGDDEAAPASGSATSIDADTPASLEFQPPVRLISDTEYVETDVLDDGNLLVTHWIRSSEPLGQLSISVPVPPEGDEPPVEATDLVVAADGVRLDPPDTLVSDAVSDAASTALPGASDLYVQYHLAGTLQRNGSTAGRALATMTSLDVEVDNDVISRMQVFPGTQVLTVACLAPGPTALPRPCGTVDEGTWSVSLEAEALRDTVIVQFDLDTAG